MTSEKLNLKEIKEVALNILIYVDDICQKNQLRYSVYYGTLLGAVRHQGFIPWDDDIDIVLPRPDYEKLLEILSSDPNYILASPLNSTSYRYTYSKLFDPKTKLVSKQILGYEDKNSGVFIDIFPLDGVPKDKEEQKKYANELDVYKLGIMNTLGFLYARSYSYLRTIAKSIVKYPKHRKYKKKGNYEYWRNLYEKNSVRYPFEKSILCGHLEFIKYEKAIYPTNWFSKDSFDRIDFEGYKVNAIKDSEIFLKQYFGDYMTLPPKEEQISNHPYEFYWK